MNNATCKKSVKTLLTILIVLAPLVSGSGSTVRSDELLITGGPFEGPMVVLRADDRYSPARVPPLLLDSSDMGIQSVPFSVNYNPTNCPGTVAAWPANAQAAFDYAVNIWSVLLNGDQTVVVAACWDTSLSGNTLAEGGAGAWISGFASAPVSDTQYPVALANQLEGADLNGDSVELGISFNGNVAWYYGLDGDTPAGQIDFVTVVLHEIAHGLGFMGTMDRDDGIGLDECSGTTGEGCWGWGTGNPNAYDRFAENGSDQNLVTSFGNPSLALGTQLISNNLFFDGSNANAANGGSPPQLEAPSPWDPGSSFSHLDEGTYNGTLHALMTPFLSLGESAHHPGPIVLGILEDIGWDMPNLSGVYVDVDATGYEDGTTDHPFDTVIEGANAVYPGGTVWIGPGTYAETLIIHRPMTLRENGGIATIGE
jgi:hypothetical protein